MTRRNLILIHRGPEYEADFDDISRRVFALDEDITIYSTAAGASVQLPKEAWARPTLTVALVQNFNLQIKRGAVLKNSPISKLAQAKIFHDAGIATPPVQSFKVGMQLDPIMFGQFVMIKPMSLELTSKGDGIQVFRRNRLEQMRPIDFPPDHLIHRDREGYLVQKFINSGRYPSTYRVVTFLGSVLYAMKIEALEPSPDLTEHDSVIEKGNFTQKGRREYFVGMYPDQIALGKRIAAAFSNIPLLAIDLVCEEATQNLYALEVNAGGNTWHFSSEMWAKRRVQFPELARHMKEQFSAFDTAAHSLVEKAHQLAS